MMQTDNCNDLVGNDLVFGQVYPGTVRVNVSALSVLQVCTVQH